MTDLATIGFGRRDALAELLPLIVRRLDAAGEGPLRDLLRAIGEQVAVVEESIAQLGDDAFIETCSDAMVPYLAQLVGWTPVPEAGVAASGTGGRDVARAAALVPRRDVGNTVRHRRRKGTLALLEDLAHDVAGWPAVAVELFRVLAVTQHLDHLRLDRGRLVDVRAMDELERLDGPFDRLAHTVDVRRIDAGRRGGWHNVPSVGLFVWRLRSYSMTGAPAGAIDHGEGGHAFTFDPLYRDVPLFVRAGVWEEGRRPRGATDPPGPITRRMLEVRDAPGAPGRPGASPTLYGEGGSILIRAEGWPAEGANPTTIPAAAVRVADLSDWRRVRVRPGTVALDPELGRMLFAPEEPPTAVTAWSSYGFSAEMGGGEYDRALPEGRLADLARVRADHLPDPEALAALVRERTAPGMRVIESLWPHDARGAPGSLAEAVDRALATSALFEALAGEDAAPPPSGGELVVANRVLLQAAYPDLIAPAVQRAATGPELAAALDAWAPGAALAAVIELTATAVYDTTVSLTVPSGRTLVLRAANRRRPILWTPDRRPDRADAIVATLGQGSTLVLDGLTVAGRVRLRAAAEAQEAEGEGDDERCGDCAGTLVRIRHCALVPGRVPASECDPPPTALEAADLGGGRLAVDRSILGPIAVLARRGAEPLELDLADSILDALSPENEAIGAVGPGVALVRLVLARSTVVGTIDVQAAELIENAIVRGVVTVARRRRGCARYSFLEPGSLTPPRVACQPDGAVAGLGEGADKQAVAREVARVRPRFTSRSWGAPGYMQLAAAVAEEIRRGADDASEMGVFHDLFQPQRHAILAARLQEHLPAGMHAGILYVT